MTPWKVTCMRFLLSFMLLWFVVLRPESSPAHDGTGVSIGFTSPHGITVVEDSSLKITWDDGDVQEEALHRLFVQPHNIPPTHVPASKHVGELQQITILL